MGFDLYGKSENYFRNNCWWWRPLQMLITITCEDILTMKDATNLGWNDNGFIGGHKARVIGTRLENLLEDAIKLNELKERVMSMLPQNYADCWSEDNIKEFAKFCKESKGFYVN